jgi:HK97 family phage prohead protease
MTTIQHPTELRDVSVKGRLLDMIAVPFNTPEWVPGDAGWYREAFAPGAFSKFERADRWHRVQLRYEHADGVPYGRATELRDDGRYLRATMRLTRGESADRLLAQVEDGDIKGVSVGFVPGQDIDDVDAEGPLVRRVTVKHLAEISLTESPVYSEAQVVAVRASTEKAREDLKAWIEQARRGML